MRKRKVAGKANVINVKVKMNAYTTPSPLTQTSTDTFPTFSDLVTKIGKKDIYSSTEDFVALVG
ncbi:hypothetical protein CHARACLAT_009811, partial [Characodon lateralis]|nr:hypothetical protein [Characodon lateralis]